MFSKILFCTLALGAAVKADLKKRDNPFWVQAYQDGKPYGDEFQLQGAEAGMIADLNLPCGVVEVESNTAQVTQCNFYLPSQLGGSPDTPWSGTPAAGYFSLAVPASCGGIISEIVAGNSCSDCGSIGEIPDENDCHGNQNGKNDVNLCTGSNFGLVEC